MIIDSHAHYDDEKFDNDREEILKRIQNHGVVRVVNPASNADSARKCLKMAKEYDFLYTAVGIHPHDAKYITENTLDSFRDMAGSSKVIAVGEVGLDYYYDFSPREIQRSCFIAHIRLARELKLPMIIHDRDAHKDILDIIREEKASDVGGVFHCFTGSVEMAKEVLDLGFYIALGGAVTFKNAKKPVEVAKYVPMDRLLVETDSPYMAPVPYRGQRNDSTTLSEIVQKIAQVRETDLTQIMKATTVNADRLFGLNLSLQEEGI